MRFTRKKGGELKNDIFKYIESIGYEIETTDFTKLTLLTDPENPDEQFFLNTSLARADIEELESSDKVIDVETDQDILFKSQEVYKVPMIGNRGKPILETITKKSGEKVEIVPNVKFYITHDFYKTSLVLDLESECVEDSAEDIYKIRLLENGEEYPIRFVSKADENCSYVTDVEWIFTYYQPRKYKNIILDTLALSLRNIIDHLGKLEEKTCNFIYTPRGEENSENDSTEKSEEKEIIIGNPEERIIYNLPGTDLHYIQSSNQFSKIPGKPSYYSAGAIVQMTFGSKLKNVWAVMSNLADGNDKIIIKKATIVVNELLENYKSKEGDIQILPQFENNLREYMHLFYYKLVIYYNFYQQKIIEFKTAEEDNIKYFKDFLGFNIRHKNITIYEQIKGLLEKYYPMKTAEERKMAIIDLMIDEDILLKNILFEGKTVKKRTFNKTFVVEKGTTRYGDLGWSLRSYLDFFDDPIIAVDENVVLNENDIHERRDWLVYKGYDTYSTTMPIKNNYILIEMRGFPKIFKAYMEELLGRKIERRGITFEMMEEFLNKYDGKYNRNRVTRRVKSISKSKTRSRSRSKSK